MCASDILLSPSQTSYLICKSNCYINYYSNIKYIIGLNKISTLSLSLSYHMARYHMIMWYSIAVCDMVFTLGHLLAGGVLSLPSLSVRPSI